MSIRVSQYGVDLYKVTINEGGVIELDAPGGVVKINGDLNITGNSSSVSSQDLIVSDNIIILNDGEEGPGVSLGTSGIQISRGDSDTDARVFWYEGKSFLNPDTGLDQPGAFSFELGDGELVGIYTNSIQVAENGNLFLINQGTGVVSVTGTTDYEKQIFAYTGNDISFNIATPDRLAAPADDDILPNIKSVKDYVRSYHLYNYQSKISSPTPEGTTEVRLFDVAAGDPDSKAEIAINGTVVSSFEESVSYIYNLRFEGSTLINNDIAQPMTIQSNEGTIIVDGALNLVYNTEPAQPTTGTIMYTSTEQDGGTGIFFKTETGTHSELVSKDKALLYSLLF